MNTKKQYILILLIISLFVNTASSQGTDKDKFYQGVTYFSAGSYKEALQVWTDIYNTGYRSANLDYNIGNAYFKLNNVPYAILFYERASLLKPADEDINYNIQVAKTLIVDRFQEIPELFFIKWYNFVSLFLSTAHPSQKRRTPVPPSGGPVPRRSQLPAMRFSRRSVPWRSLLIIYSWERASRPPLPGLPAWWSNPQEPSSNRPARSSASSAGNLRRRSSGGGRR